MKTLKKLLFIIMAVAVLAVPVFGVQAAENDIPVTEQSGVSPTSSPVPIRELVTKGNKIYYYYKGKMVKNKWKRYNGYKYYFGANGNAVRGGQRINNVVYVFDEKGRLFENKQNKIVKSGSNIYHIRTEHGRASIGYFIYKNNLYYADPKGRLYQKKSRQNGQLYFTNSGAARKDYNALLKNACRCRLYRQITKFRYRVRARSFMHVGNMLFTEDFTMVVRILTFTRVAGRAVRH